jgi:hypothetical protein
VAAAAAAAAAHGTARMAAGTALATGQQDPDAVAVSLLLMRCVLHLFDCLSKCVQLCWLASCCKRSKCLAAAARDCTRNRSLLAALAAAGLYSCLYVCCFWQP